MASTCNCSTCVPDPAFTCSYTGDQVSIMSVYVPNAYKGHLILCPGGANGQIGGLLHQLTPPQHYSHMGILVHHHELIRHTTAHPGRLTAEEYYAGSVLGVSAPVDGLQAEHVQYGWPGSVTQSAEQIFSADRYGDAYHGADLPDKESPSGKRYQIAALSFEGAFDDGEWYPALVVKPCPVLVTPAVTAALERVADEALRLYAHYRFYCYSDGSIGGQPAFGGPAVELPEALPAWDPATMKWRDWSDPNTIQWVQRKTIPAVCSSFVWQAVQNVNKAGPPQLVLDWALPPAAALGEAGGACERCLPPDWAADTPDALDGLYTYDDASRAKAAAWLKRSLSDHVFDSLKSALADKGGAQKVIATAIDDVGRGAFIAAATAGAGALVALLAPVLGPAGLAVDAVLAEQLIELLYDMPEDIANQVCNSFAFDCHRGFPGDPHCVDAAGTPITDLDSDHFLTSPGTGHAVSPNNIHMFWDAPGPSDPNETIRGLYGYNESVQLVVGVVKRPVCVLVPSTGTATITGRVFFKGEPIRGADVEISCQHTKTDDHGYSLTVRSGGQYLVLARYRDPATCIGLYGQRATGKPGDPPIAPGAVVSVDITLLEPPRCLRNVLVEGKLRVDDVYLTGADHDDTQFKKTLHVQYGVATFDETAGKWIIDPNDPVTHPYDVFQDACDTGDAHARIKVEATAKSDLSVDITVTGTLNPGDENLSETHTVNVPEGQTKTIDEFDLDTGGPFPDRAYFRSLTFTNLAGQAM